MSLTDKKKSSSVPSFSHPVLSLPLISWEDIAPFWSIPDIHSNQKRIKDADEIDEMLSLMLGVSEDNNFTVEDGKVSHSPALGDARIQAICKNLVSSFSAPDDFKSLSISLNQLSDSEKRQRLVEQNITPFSSLAMHARLWSFCYFMSDDQRGLSSHNFASELSKLLTEFFQSACQIEQEHNRSLLSLEKFKYIVQPGLYLLEKLDALCIRLASFQDSGNPAAIGPHLINILYSLYVESIGDEKLCKVYLRLLRSSVQPHLKILSGWIFRGELKDPWGEFVIRQKKETSLDETLSTRSPMDGLTSERDYAEPELDELKEEFYQQPVRWIQSEGNQQHLSKESGDETIDEETEDEQEDTIDESQQEEKDDDQDKTFFTKKHLLPVDVDRTTNITFKTRGWNDFEYWRESFLVEERNTLLFLSPFTDKILLSGKYLNILRACQTHSEGFSSLSKQHSMSSPHHISASQPPILSSILIPISISEEKNDLIEFSSNFRIYEGLVEGAYKSASSKLLHYLVNEQHFVVRLNSMKKFFLLDQPDFVLDLLERARTELKSPPHQVNVEKLNNILQLSLQSSTLKEPLFNSSHSSSSSSLDNDRIPALSPSSSSESLNDNLKCFLSSTSLLQQSLDMFNKGRPATMNKTNDSQSVNSEDLICLRYEAFSFPILGIIGDHIEEKYQLLFRLKLKLIVSRRDLNECWKILNYSRHIQIRGSLRVSLNKLMMLRQNAFNFLMTFDHYLSLQVVEFSWEKFHQSLDQIRTIEELQQFHDLFLESCLRNSFLQTPDILKALEYILSAGRNILAILSPLANMLFKRSTRRRPDPKISPFSAKLVEQLQYHENNIAILSESLQSALSYFVRNTSKLSAETKNSSMALVLVKLSHHNLLHV